MKRRQFLNSLLACPFILSYPLKAKEQFSNQSALYTIGENYKNSSQQSIVTKVRLSDGEITQNVISLPWGHLVSEYKKGEVLVSGYHSPSLMVLNQENLHVVRTIQLPENYICSGHFKVHNKKIYIALYPEDYYKDSARAALAIYDLDKEKEIKLIPFSTQGCHDVKAIDDKHILVSLKPRKKKTGLHYPPSGGGLAIIDTEKDEVINEFKIPGNGAPDHIGVFDLEHIFVGFVQYIPFKEKEFLEKYLGNSSRQFLKQLNPTTQRQQKIAIHNPLMKFNFRNYNNKKKIDLELVKGEQRKLLSFAVDHQRDIMFATCGHSNTLISFNPKTGKLLKSWNGQRLGLKSLQGVTLLPNGLLAVSDDHKGISIFNHNTEAVIKHYKPTLHSSTHLTAI